VVCEGSLDLARVAFGLHDREQLLRHFDDIDGFVAILTGSR
jgi:hypothetical protein